VDEGNRIKGSKYKTSAKMEKDPGPQRKKKTQIGAQKMNLERKDGRFYLHKFCATLSSSFQKE